jgi:hypothetical protein
LYVSGNDQVNQEPERYGKSPGPSIDSTRGLAADKRWSEAVLAVCQRVVDRPADAAAYAVFAGIRLMTNRAGVAERSAWRACASNPRDSMAQVAAATVLAVLKRRIPASRALRRALICDPGVAANMRRLASVGYRLGDPGLANVLAERAWISGDPEAAVVGAHLCAAGGADRGPSISTLRVWLSRLADRPLRIGLCAAMKCTGGEPHHAESLVTLDELAFADALSGALALADRAGRRSEFLADLLHHSELAGFQVLLIAEMRFAQGNIIGFTEAMERADSDPDIGWRALARLLDTALWCCDFDRVESLRNRLHAGLEARMAEIDVLIDLAGYMTPMRIGMFAHRPAPVTAYWIGHGGGLGLPDAYDYLIADHILVPPELEADYVERVVRLRDSFQPADAPEIPDVPVSREAEGLPHTGIVFCAFNNPRKIDRSVPAPRRLSAVEQTPEDRQGPRRRSGLGGGFGLNRRR